MKFYCFDIKQMYEENKNIKLFDEEGDLKIYHYLSCDINSSQEDKEVRGLVYKDNSLVCRSFDFTAIIETKDELLEKIFKDVDFSKVKFFPSLEGTVVRLYFVDVWHLSTHKKIDAFKSMWGNNIKE